jgi:formylglycine-generating enzyme required for sulfatase activity
MRAILFPLLFSGLLLPLAAHGEDPPKRVMGKDGAPMVLVPGGEFTMGSEDKEIKELAPPHSVSVVGFYMDVYEVTNELFAEFLNTQGLSEKKNAKRWNWVVLRTDLKSKDRATWWPTEIIHEDGEYRAFRGFGSHPVMTVSWDAADAYCKLAGKRLPTEAEWERAARGGQEGKRFPWGDEIPTLGIVYGKQWKNNQDPPPTKPVGNYYPNAYGLYDMAGSVWEWCYDWFSIEYYLNSPKKNPKGPESGYEKVLRGGSWVSSSNDLKVATRNSSPPFVTDDGVGFRCSMDARGAGNEK